MSQEPIIGLLSAYITDKKIVNNWMQQQWENYLGKPYSDLVSELIKDNLLEESSTEVKLSIITNKKLKELLKNNDLKISGKKSILVERIIENIPQEGEKLSQTIKAYVCTDKGKKIAVLWKNEIQKRGQEADKQVEGLIKKNKIQKAFQVIERLKPLIPLPLHQYYGVGGYKGHDITSNDWGLWIETKEECFFRFEFERINFWAKYEGPFPPTYSPTEALEFKTNYIMIMFFLKWNWEEKFYYPNDKEKQREIRGRRDFPLEFGPFLGKIKSDREDKEWAKKVWEQMEKRSSEYLDFLRREGITQVKITGGSDRYEDRKRVESGTYRCKECSTIADQVYQTDDAPILPNPSCEEKQPCSIYYIGYGKEWEEYGEENAKLGKFELTFDSKTGRGEIREMGDDGQ